MNNTPFILTRVYLQNWGQDHLPLSHIGERQIQDHYFWRGKLCSTGLQGAPLTFPLIVICKAIMTSFQQMAVKCLEKGRLFLIHTKSQ